MNKVTKWSRQKSVTFLAQLFHFSSTCCSEASPNDGRRTAGTTLPSLMSSIWLSPDRALGIQSREFNSCLIRPENLSFILSESFKCCLSNCCQAVMWLFLRSIFSSDHSPTKSRWCRAAETVVLLAACSFFFFCRELPKLFEISYLVTGPQRVVLGGSKFLQRWSALCSWEPLFFFFLFFLSSSSSDLRLSRILSVESFLDFMAWFLALTCMWTVTPFNRQVWASSKYFKSIESTSGGLQ